MQQASFGYHNDLARGRFLAKGHHFFGGTNFICEHAHSVGTLRVRNDGGIWIFFADFVYAARRELDVHVTGALPQIHSASCAFHYPCAEILVRNKENISIDWRCANDLVCVAAGANHVGQRFHASTAIDVGDHVIIFVRVLSQKLRQLFRRTRFGERAAGIEIRQNHTLGRINDLGCFRHEMDATKQDDVRVSFRGLITQA